LGAKSNSIRERAGRDPDLAGLGERRADLSRRPQDLQTRTQTPEPQIVDGLHADFDNQAQSIDQWIERQDAKAQPPLRSICLPNSGALSALSRAPSPSAGHLRLYSFQIGAG